MVGNDVMNPGQPQRWMEKPAGDTSPLALLRPLDSLLAKQIVSFTESMYDFDRQSRKKSAFFFSVLTGLPTQAKYGVFNDLGEQVFYAFEGK